VFFCILLLCCKRPLFTLLHSEFRNGHSNATLLHVNFIIPKQIHTHAHFRTRCGSPFPLHHALLRQLVAHSASAGQACKKLELFVIWLRYRKKNVKQRGAHHTERKWNVHGIITTDAHWVNSRDRSVPRPPLLGGVPSVLFSVLKRMLRQYVETRTFPSTSFPIR